MTTPTGDEESTDDEEPIVSAVLPTHNRGEVVGDAIESVLGQSSRNLELLVVDGGSTDETPAVVANGARRFLAKRLWLSAERLGDEITSLVPESFTAEPALDLGGVRP